MKLLHADGCCQGEIRAISETYGKGKPSVYFECSVCSLHVGSIGDIKVASDNDKITQTDQQLNRVLDDILRQVVCDCGNYRHHGVQWMPEGSGEGFSVAKEILRKLLAGERG